MQPASSVIRRSIWGSGCVVMICRRLIPVSPKVTAQGTPQKMISICWLTGSCRFNCVLEVESTFHVIVMAGGQGYIVHVRNGLLLKHFGGDIENLIRIPELRSTLVSHGLWLRLFKGEAEVWCTERLSLDGIRNIQVSLADGLLRGRGGTHPKK